MSEAAERAKIAAARARAVPDVGSAWPIRIMCIGFFAVTGAVAYNLHQKGRLPYVSRGHTLQDVMGGSFKQGSDYQYNNRAKK